MHRCSPLQTFLRSSFQSQPISLSPRGFSRPLKMHSQAGLFDDDDDCTHQLGNEKITYFLKQGQPKAVIKAFQSMCSSGVIISAYTISVTLSACVTLEDLYLGMQIHAIYVMSIAKPSSYVTSTLINMYTSFGSLEDAWNVYDKTIVLDVVSCNAMITGYAKHGHSYDAIQIYKSMYSRNVVPNDITFTSTLNACSKVEDLECCRQLHTEIVILGRDSTVFIENVLIDVYSKCGTVEEPWHIFYEMMDRDVISWNVMIAAYGKHSSPENAFKLFWQMQQEGIHPNERTFVNILSACNNAEYIEKGKQLHTLVEDSGFQSNSIVCSTVVDMYTKCGNMANAMNFFERISKLDVVLWNVVLTANAKQGFMKEVFELFERMKREGIRPDRVTFLSICHVCGSLEALEKAKEVHACIVKAGISTDLRLGNGIIDMYGKCKCLDDAHHVFDNLSERDVISWTAIIAGNVQQELHENAVYLYDCMLWEGVSPNHVTFLSLLNAVSIARSSMKGRQLHCQIISMRMKVDVILENTLIHMYGKCGALDMACKIFYGIAKANAIIWNTMISVYAESEYVEKAFKLFSQMKVEGVIPNEVTYLSVLGACASKVAFEQGKQIHVSILSASFDSSCFVASALIDVYGKCGDLDKAHEVLRRLVRRDVGSWGALITAYAQHGHGKRALELAAQMSGEGIKMNHISLLSILSACSHGGLVNEGSFFFYTLSHQHGVKPSARHYACMVDLLGRAGRLEEAYTLIQKMQGQPSASLWMSLLSACRSFGNVDLATNAAEKVHQLRPQSAAPFQLLIDTHFSATARLTQIEQL